MDGYKEFEFDLPDALLTSLVKVFDGMSAAPLIDANVRRISDEQGVYQLIFGGQVVYIGKTDGDAGLNSRLSRHAKRVQHRKNLDPELVTFKAIRVFVFTAVDLEAQLIRHYSKQSLLAWNGSGFGSNDPGRNRDDTVLKADAFDALYEIDVDVPLSGLEVSATADARSVLLRLRAVVPYTFRTDDLSELQHIIVPPLTTAHPTARDILIHVFKSLPPGWHATKLAGRVIVYKETKTYKQGQLIIRS